MYLKKNEHLFDSNFKALFIDTAFKVMGHNCQWQCSKRDTVSKPKNKYKTKHADRNVHTNHSYFTPWLSRKSGD